jgi:hypothetical protein
MDVACRVMDCGDRAVRLAINTRRISQAKMDLIIADIVKKDGSRSPTPNEMLKKAKEHPKPQQGPEEEGGIEEQSPMEKIVEEAEKVFDPVTDSVTANEPVERKLMICFPCYRNTNPATLMSILGMWDRSKMMFALEHGTVLINARNRLANTFLRSGCEWSFWLDDDMVAPFGNEMSFRGLTGIGPAKLSSVAADTNSITRLVQTAKQRNAKIVSGLYFGRNNQGRAMYAEAIASKAADNEARTSAGKDFIKETKWAATGCLLIHRDAFLAVKNHAPIDGNNYPFFTPEGYQGEDQAFGTKALRAGIKSFVDHRVVCAHMGHAFYNHTNTEWTA